MKKVIYKAVSAMDKETKALLFCAGMMGIVYVAVTIVDWMYCILV